MLYAVKGNKRYQVGDNASLRTDFLNRGYDIVDETGKTVQVSPAKTVPYAKYAALLDENAELKRQLSAACEPVPDEAVPDDIPAAEKPKGKKT